jgi:hypothetical protein
MLIITSIQVRGYSYARTARIASARVCVPACHTGIEKRISGRKREKEGGGKSQGSRCDFALVRLRLCCYTYYPCCASSANAYVYMHLASSVVNERNVKRREGRDDVFTFDKLGIV